MYKFFRNLLFLFPTEAVHHFSMNALKWVCKWGFLKRQITAYCRPVPNGPTMSGDKTQNEIRENHLEKELFGLRFRNPVGLGAGFDKNALYLTALEALGFGFVEIGTVTPRPQPGNEQPRLFRLPEDQALINRMGFNNDGAPKIAERLRRWRTDSSKPVREEGRQRLIVGGNIGKNKDTPNEDAWKDYELCFIALFSQVDYFVVNVSSPNTPGLRELQEKNALRKILTNLQRINGEIIAERGGRPKPLLLKIAPDLSRNQIDDTIALALEIKLDGLVVANTSIGREKLLSPPARIEAIGAGGLSGAPLKERATEIVRYIHDKTRGVIPIIASGGIFSGEDAKEKIKAGASLVQVWTGFIYEGPLIVRALCREL